MQTTIQKNFHLRAPAQAVFYLLRNFFNTKQGGWWGGELCNDDTLL